MIPEDHKSELITAGIGFLRSITAAYGTEKGMAVWNHMAEAIDVELKGAIFFSILMGDREDIIRIHGISPIPGNYKKIMAIKEIRSWTGMGLTESKNVVDQVELGQTMTIQGKASTRSLTVSALRINGLMV